MEHNNQNDNNTFDSSGMKLAGQKGFNAFKGWAGRKVKGATKAVGKFAKAGIKRVGAMAGKAILAAIGPVNALIGLAAVILIVALLIFIQTFGGLADLQEKIAKAWNTTVDAIVEIFDGIPAEVNKQVDLLESSHVLDDNEYLTIDELRYYLEKENDSYIREEIKYKYSEYTYTVTHDNISNTTTENSTSNSGEQVHKQNFGAYEANYRVPWQELATIFFYNYTKATNKEVEDRMEFIEELIEPIYPYLRTEFTYAYPDGEFVPGKLKDDYHDYMNADDLNAAFQDMYTTTYEGTTDIPGLKIPKNLESWEEIVSYERHRVYESETGDSGTFVLVDDTEVTSTHITLQEPTYKPYIFNSPLKTVIMIYGHNVIEDKVVKDTSNTTPITKIKYKEVVPVYDDDGNQLYATHEELYGTKNINPTTGKDTLIALTEEVEKEKYQYTVTKLTSTVSSDKPYTLNSYVSPTDNYMKTIEEKGNIKEQDLGLYYNLMSMYPGGIAVLNRVNETISEKIGNDFLSVYLDYMYDTSFGLVYSDLEFIPSDSFYPIPYLSQKDERWANVPYGDTIGRSGCGITSYAMIIQGMSDTQVSVPELALKYGSKYFIDGQGTSYSLYYDTAATYGLNVTHYSPDQADIVLQNLSMGNPCIVTVRPGTFSSAGHIMVITGITEDGKLYVHDPNNFDQNTGPTLPERVLASASNFFVFEKY